MYQEGRGFLHEVNLGLRPDCGRSVTGSPSGKEKKGARQMRKRVIAALLAAVMVSGAFTGCGKTKERVNEQGESVITVWSPSDEPAIEEWWISKIEEFNQAHEGEIELRREAIVRADSHAYEDKVNAAITSNDLPDILYVDGPNVSIYAANEVTLPLYDFFPEEEWADFFDSSKQQNTYDGKIYVVGATESSVALYYNKDLLDEAGISVPESREDAWTWSEYYDAAKKLTKDGVVLDFVAHWNDFMWPLLVVMGEEKRTIQLAIQTFFGSKPINYGPIMASLTISAIPMLLMFIFLQKYYVEGIASTGIKG